MRKKIIASIIATLMVVSLSGCGSKKVDSSKSNESKVKNEQMLEQDKVNDEVKTDNTETNEYVEVLPDPDFFKVASEKESAELAYKPGQYKEVDGAYNILKTYYVEGVDKIYDLIVDFEYDENKVLFMPLGDEKKEDLKMEYDYMKRKIPQKITGIKVEYYNWSTSVSTDPKNQLSIYFSLVLETETGDSYMTGTGLTAFKDKNGELKFAF
ncbi:hypothetical protein [Clostridium sp. YIM B02506]|jgi:hypothetical protein|uniref:LptM family lipoprotein n=1 Tax=Clostridium sp. YIM B02506 TaxID=2910680 RepID=UPI001EED0259|nr:hypothetical protein [Clostridium sp. YIM B02506]